MRLLAARSRSIVRLHARTSAPRNPGSNQMAQPPAAHRATCITLLMLVGVTPCSTAAPLTVLDGARAPDLSVVTDAFRARDAAPQLLGRAISPAAWSAVPVLDAATIDAAPLRDEDARLAGPGVPLRTGIVLGLDAAVDPARDGAWSTDPDGSSVWRISIRTSNAASIGVHFTSFQLPAGAVISFAGVDGIARSFEGLGPNRGEACWTPAVIGERVDIEYRQPAGTAAAPDFTIDQIAHHYRPIADPQAFQELGLDAATYGPRDSLLQPCQVDVLCRTPNTTARDSVGAMLFQSGGGFYVCSGALLNDVDTNTFAAWFLTANHCINTQVVASTLTVYWFYQSSLCNGTVPAKSSVPTTSGATLLANSGDTDFAFLRLNDDVNAGQGLAGWNSAPFSGNVVGIHHPGGSFKRWSSGFTTTAAPICGGLPLSGFVYCDWNDGITEGGSSGSPLFDSSWRVIGQLFGSCYYNPPACDNPQDYNNVYGRFEVSYPLFSSYLNTIIPDDAYEPNDSAATAKSIGSGTRSLRLVDFDDYFLIKVCSQGQYDITATYTESQMDMAMRLQTVAGSVLASSNRTTGTEALRVTLNPGDYVLRVWRTKRQGGDYSLTLPSMNRADFNGDGFVNFEDFDAFVVAFESGLANADFNGDGFLTFEDFDAFVAGFQAGC